ncbi:aspartate/glutamate racemase family protein [Roseibacterium sp. SDUM158016]|uniref:maleate cis-trans isomerase family protein n=1 Tax=Roseicyclus sediminis TaxID=2980997 RepID=UPI0021CFC963|nr:aspartate/glutamate racemase family protein [Roseibacterium sp. SDUM158016]MCU4652757.1 aspartate/glutamate racemase family protein [Roseibacterium sp. SDUM158016]
MTGTFPYRLCEDPRPRFGAVVLQVDETVEEDLRHAFPPDAARLHVSRVPSGAELTAGTIAEMEGHLTRAAALLPAVPHDAVAYACTSGTSLIGAVRVADLIRAGCDCAHVTNPLTAALAAFSEIGAARIALVSPYIAEVAEPIRAAFVAAGHEVPSAVSFGERVEARVARIDPASIREAALRALDGSGADCVFLSCTNLRTREILPALSAETGRPVLSSNHVLAWHMARLAGIEAPRLHATS